MQKLSYTLRNLFTSFHKLHIEFQIIPARTLREHFVNPYSYIVNECKILLSSFFLTKWGCFLYEIAYLRHICISEYVFRYSFLFVNECHRCRGGCGTLSSCLCFKELLREVSSIVDGNKEVIIIVIRHKSYDCILVHYIAGLVSFRSLSLDCWASYRRSPRPPFGRISSYPVKTCYIGSWDLPQQAHLSSLLPNFPL